MTCLTYIVDSTIFLFAEDTKIFKEIETTDDKESLQDDLNTINTWTETWLLRLHPDKCKYMHVGRTNPDPDFEYHLAGQKLNQVTEEKDIGVVVDHDLNFDKHICEKVKKANSMAALIRRIFRHLDQKSFPPLYKALVRTHLDYASSVWAPCKARHIDIIEGVQCYQRRLGQHLQE